MNLIHIVMQVSKTIFGLGWQLWTGGGFIMMSKILPLFKFPSRSL